MTQRPRYDLNVHIRLEHHCGGGVAQIVDAQKRQIIGNLLVAQCAQGCESFDLPTLFAKFHVVLLQYFVEFFVDEIMVKMSPIFPRTDKIKVFIGSSQLVFPPFLLLEQRSHFAHNKIRQHDGVFAFFDLCRPERQHGR